MSYYETGMNGLGSIASSPNPGPFHAGQEFIAGYLPLAAGDGPTKKTAIVNAVASRVHGVVTGSGWGGPGAPGGVPAGSVWVTIRSTREGVTGAQMDAAFAAAATVAAAALPAGSRVTNTHAWTFGAAPSGTPTGLPPTTDPVTGLISAFSTPTVDPATGPPYGTMLPPAENFFTQSVGGIPVWGLLTGGAVALGGVAYVMMGSKSRAAPAAVKANRRRRSRRNGRKRSR